MIAERVLGGWKCTFSYGTPLSPRVVYVWNDEIAAADNLTKMARHGGKFYPRKIEAIRDAIAIGKRCGSYWLFLEKRERISA